MFQITRAPKPTMRMATMSERTLACRCRRRNPKAFMEVYPPSFRGATNTSRTQDSTMHTSYIRLLGELRRAAHLGGDLTGQGVEKGNQVCPFLCRQVERLALGRQPGIRNAACRIVVHDLL